MRPFQNPRFYLVSLTVGLILAASLLALEGISEVGAALVMAGWNILWVVAFRFIPMAVDALGWKHLIAGFRVPSYASFVLYRWVAESCNTLLPAAQVGGHLVRALMLARRLQARALAGASVVVDFSLGLGTQSLFILTGLLMLLFQSSLTPNIALLSMVLLGGLMIFGCFFLVQYRGLSAIFNRIARRFWNNRKIMQVAGGLEALEKKTGQLYSDHRRLMTCAVLRFIGWMVKSGETYLALLFLGASPTVTEALIVEAVGVAANSFGFLVPGALGIRESGILAVAALLGLPAESALALAMIKRGRELALGLPGLVVLFIMERDILSLPKNRLG